MPPLIWQRQPGETPADFTAFIAYLRLKGRRSHRLAATQTGRPLGAIRRLSAKFNWPARVAAFEARLADASQDALNLHVRATSARTAADFERLRFDEFLLARRVIDESSRWLQLASDPRRRDISFGQVCRLIELAFKLARLAAGMPTGDEPRGRPRREDAPGYWTSPTAEEALHKIYGSPATTPPVAPASDKPGAPPSGPQNSGCGGKPMSPISRAADDDSPSPGGQSGSDGEGRGEGELRDHQSSTGTQFPAAELGVQKVGLVTPCVPTAADNLPGAVPVDTPATSNHVRRDAWASWSGIQRQSAAARSR